MRDPGCSNKGFEENILAILDSSGAKDACDVLDDRLSFLEAVRFASLVSDTPTTPSCKICNAIFAILRESTSVELAMASYQLLTELDQRYPRVCVTTLDGTEGSSSELVVVEEAWSPFIIGSDFLHNEVAHAPENPGFLIDSSRFCQLVEAITHAVKSQSGFWVKNVEDMLVFQYLVGVLEADLLPRQTVHKETPNWVLLRESILNMLLASRKLNFKSLVKDCMLSIHGRSHGCKSLSLRDIKNTDSSSAVKTCGIDVGLMIASAELEKRTCIAMQKLLALIMELDAMRKEADINGFTSRIDGRRTPLLEIILDELTYDKDHMSAFLEVFSESKWKLEIVLQFFSKYCAKPSIRTRRSSESLDDTTFKGVLNLFLTASRTKTIVKKINPEVARLLMAHAFQASLSLKQCPEDATHFDQKMGTSSLFQICDDIIVALKNLQKIDENRTVTSFEKEAIFTAAAILTRR